MAEPVPTYCSTCTFVNRKTVEKMPSFWSCTSPQVPRVRDMVSGTLVPALSSCTMLRTDPAYCGSTGRWWESTTEGKGE